MEANEDPIRIEIKDQIALCNITNLHRDNCPVAIVDSKPVVVPSGESLYEQPYWQYMALAVAELFGDSNWTPK